MVRKSFPNKEKPQKYLLNIANNGTEYNRRECPACGLLSIKGMPGGRDATCTNCGYKDPCCYD